jgi:hypothetical protein
MKKCEHEGRTQQAPAKASATCYAPLSAQILYRNGIAKAFARPLPVQTTRRLQNSRRMPGGTPGLAMFAPAPCAMFAAANKQTCDFGLPKSVFFRPFFVQRQRKYITPVQRSAKQYARP